MQAVDARNKDEEWKRKKMEKQAVYWSTKKPWKRLYMILGISKEDFIFFKLLQAFYNGFRRAL